MNIHIPLTLPAYLVDALEKALPDSCEIIERCETTAGFLGGPNKNRCDFILVVEYAQ